MFFFFFTEQTAALIYYPFEIETQERKCVHIVCDWKSVTDL